MKKSLLIHLFSFLALHSIPQEISLLSLVPDPASMNGWEYSREPECYSGDALFDLIDGAADVYFEYGFTKAVNVQYSELTGSKIQLEIYQMESDSSAYGIFSSIYNSSDVTRDIGLYSVIKDQYVSFVKSRYYINVAWVLRKDAHRVSLLNLAREVEKKIARPGDAPAIVTNLDHIQHVGLPIFFVGNIALSNIYYFDFKDPFKVSQGVAFRAEKLLKIVFLYPENGKSRSVFTSAQEFIQNSKRFGDVGMIYQGFTCSDNKGNRLAFRQGEGYIAAIVAMAPEILLLQELDNFSGSVEQVIRK